MEVHWSDEFDRQLGRMEREAERSIRAGRVLQLLAFMLQNLQQIPHEPDEESTMLKRVRQSGRHEVWRQSHPFEPGIALRLICWFPQGESTVVIALFTGEKASMGGIFYDSVGSRADKVIEQWMREQKGR